MKNFNDVCQERLKKSELKDAVGFVKSHETGIFEIDKKREYCTLTNSCIKVPVSGYFDMIYLGTLESAKAKSIEEVSDSWVFAPMYYTALFNRLTDEDVVEALGDFTISDISPVVNDQGEIHLGYNFNDEKFITLGEYELRRVLPNMFDGFTPEVKRIVWLQSKALLRFYSAEVPTWDVNIYDLPFQGYYCEDLGGCDKEVVLSLIKEGFAKVKNGMFFTNEEGETFYQGGSFDRANNSIEKIIKYMNSIRVQDHTNWSVGLSRIEHPECHLEVVSPKSIGCK